MYSFIRVNKQINVLISALLYCYFRSLKCIYYVSKSVGNTVYGFNQDRFKTWTGQGKVTIMKITADSSNEISVCKITSYMTYLYLN